MSSNNGLNRPCLRHSDLWHHGTLIYGTTTLWSMAPRHSDLWHHDTLIYGTTTLWSMAPRQSDLWHHDSLIYGTTTLWSMAPRQTQRTDLCALANLQHLTHQKQCQPISTSNPWKNFAPRNVLAFCILDDNPRFSNQKKSILLYSLYYTAPTIYPGSSGPFYIVTYYIKLVTTSCARNFWWLFF